MLMRQRWSAVVFWSVQGDAAAGVEVGDGGWRRRSLGTLDRCEEEEEGEKEKAKNEKVNPWPYL